MRGKGQEGCDPQCVTVGSDVSGKNGPARHSLLSSRPLPPGLTLHRETDENILFKNIKLVLFLLIAHIPSYLSL